MATKTKEDTMKKKIAALLIVLGLAAIAYKMWPRIREAYAKLIND